MPALLRALIAAVEADDKITVYLNSSIAKTAGAPGRFEVDLGFRNGLGTHAEFGAIVLQATGFTPYDANNLPEFSYGKSPNVVTQLWNWKHWLAPQRGPDITCNGEVVSAVVFVQCAGQRSTKGVCHHCLGHCCATSINCLMYFKDSNPDIETTVLFDDIRTPVRAAKTSTAVRKTSL